MPTVLTAASVVQCLHQGKVNPVPSQQKLVVGGAPALVMGDLTGAPVVLCPLVPSGPPPVKPCTTATMTTPPATKLTVDGKPVLLDTAAGATDGGTPPPATFSVTSAGHTKLTAS